MSKLADNFIVGFILGLIVPVIAFTIYAIINFPDSSIVEALLFYKKGNVLTHVISLSVLSNLIPFFLFLNNKKEKTANGIIGGSFVYVFIVLIIMFLK
jgi:hypothetical protein